MVIPSHTIFLLGALLLGAQVEAQQQEQPPKAQATASAQQEFEALAKEYSAAQQAFYLEQRKASEAAKAEGKPMPAMNMAGPAAEWLPKFQAGAAKYKGTDGAVPFLVWVGNNSRGPERDTVLATLLQDHIQSPALAGALRLITSQMQMAAGARLMRLDGQTEKPSDEAVQKQKEAVAAAEKRVREQLAQVIEKNPNAEVQAKALLARANLVLESRGEVVAEQKQAAIADVREAGKRATEKDTKSQCEGILFEQDHLAIGMTAPEIEGKDLDGVDFKLSDYRGKVVLLDFWGYW